MNNMSSSPNFLTVEIHEVETVRRERSGSGDSLFSFSRRESTHSKSDTDRVERRSSLKSFFSAAETTFSRRDSTLSIGDIGRVQRRSSLRNFFSKADTIDDEDDEEPSMQEQHLELFKSTEFQSYLKARHISTTTGAQVMFQQFLHDRNATNESTEKRRRATAPDHKRRNSGDSILNFATKNGKRQWGSELDNFESSQDTLLDESESMWSLDDSQRPSYLNVIR